MARESAVRDDEVSREEALNWLVDGVINSGGDKEEAARCIGLFRELAPSKKVQDEAIDLLLAQHVSPAWLKELGLYRTRGRKRDDQPPEEFQREVYGAYVALQTGYPPIQNPTRDHVAAKFGLTVSGFDKKCRKKGIAGWPPKAP